MATRIYSDVLPGLCRADAGWDGSLATGVWGDKAR